MKQRKSSILRTVFACIVALGFAPLTSAASDYRTVYNSIINGTATYEDVLAGLEIRDALKLGNLLSALRRRLPDPRIVALLEELWAGNERAYPDLPWELLRSPMVRIPLAFSLHPFRDPKDSPYLEYIREQAASKDYFARLRAMSVLGIVGRVEDIPTLVEAVRGSDPGLAKLGINSLSSLDVPQARKALRQLLDDRAVSPESKAMISAEIEHSNARPSRDRQTQPPESSNTARNRGTGPAANQHRGAQETVGAGGTEERANTEAIHRLWNDPFASSLSRGEATYEEILVGLHVENQFQLTRRLGLLRRYSKDPKVGKLLRDIWAGNRKAHPALPWHLLLTDPLRVSVAYALHPWPGEHESPYLDYVRDKVRTGEFGTRQPALLKLGTIGHESDVPTFVEFIRSDEDGMAVLAIVTLAQRNSPAARRALNELLEDEDISAEMKAEIRKSVSQWESNTTPRSK